jgi:hypothetical protein
MQLVMAQDLEDDELSDEISMSLGKKLEAAFQLKFLITQKEEEVKELKSSLEIAQKEISDEMEQKDLQKIECQYGSAKVKVEPFPNIQDHNTFFNWVADTRRFEFLEKRVSRSAAKDMLTREGTLPPGVDSFMKTSIEFRKKAVRRK